MTETQSPEMVAAVDLGSNSFHMLVARLVQGEIHVIDRLRDRVALAEGLDEKKNLAPEVSERALACLERFGQRVKHMPQGSVRAVGTNTLRQLRRARSFLAKAEEMLGHPIEIISGREEARLVYLGVAHSVEGEAQRRLVVDIGGGSTECIIGEGFEPIVADSLFMGCVNYSLRFFPKGEIDKEAFEEAQLAASRELSTIERAYKKRGWQSAVGSSGTILAIDAILRDKGFSEQGITSKGLRKLRKAIIEAKHANKLSFPGMQPDRASVLPGGLAILMAIFDTFELEQMSASTGALREGLVYDLLGRIKHEDVRDRTIRNVSERYQIDTEQAARVESTAAVLCAQASSAWSLGEEARHMLSWAARLHEIGISISYSGYHKHGAYLVTHMDMPGFSREDQQMLAALIWGHRRNVTGALFDELPAARVETALHLCVLLRLAVRLNRSRVPDAVPAIALAVSKKTLSLAFPPEWLAAHPLTHADLEEEAASLKDVGYKLNFQ